MGAIEKELSVPASSSSPFSCHMDVSLHESPTNHENKFTKSYVATEGANITIEIYDFWTQEK